MKYNLRLRLALVLAAVVFAGPAALPAQTPPERTALDDYVAAADNSFHYSLATTLKRSGVTCYVLDMTSQSWRTKEEIDPVEWRHWVLVYRPKKVESNTGLLLIEGGSNGGSVPSKANFGHAYIARVTRSIVVVLRMVPNQPIRFPGDTKEKRSEDSFIAYTWDKFLKTGDAKWAARLPMTKSAIRAMDAASEFLSKLPASPVKIEKFVVTGGSKRGWTSWTTAAVDKRVVAVMPIVIDLLNVVPSFRHHYKTYGFWAPAVDDYYEMGVMDAMGNPRFAELMRLVDPYSYKHRLTMPKYIVNSAGDQFFLPDSWRFYYDDLEGEKYLRYVPNSDHSLNKTDAMKSLVAYYQSILKGIPRPQFKWSMEPDGAIRVETASQPKSVKLWQATNPNRRDFRLEAVGPIYKAAKLKPEKPGVYIARVPSPEKGWTAYFVEMTYASGARFPFKFTTGVRVTPDNLPFDEPVPGKTKVGTKSGM